MKRVLEIKIQVSISRSIEGRRPVEAEVKNLS